MSIKKRPDETFREYIERKKRSKSYQSDQKRMRAKEMNQKNLSEARSIAERMVSGKYKGSHAIVKSNKALSVPDVHVVHNKEVNTAMFSNGKLGLRSRHDQGEKGISVETVYEHGGSIMHSRSDYMRNDLARSKSKTERMLSSAFKSAHKKFGSKSHLGSSGG